jgi:hypothetical protein
MKKEIKLNRLETRFLLNWTLEESNVLAGCETTEDKTRPSKMNINNCKNRWGYERKIATLKRKLQKLDKSFYHLNK